MLFDAVFSEYKKTIYRQPKSKKPIMQWVVFAAYSMAVASATIMVFWFMQLVLFICVCIAIALTCFLLLYRWGKEDRKKQKTKAFAEYQEKHISALSALLKKNNLDDKKGIKLLVAGCNRKIDGATKRFGIQNLISMVIPFIVLSIERYLDAFSLTSQETAFLYAAVILAMSIAYYLCFLLVSLCRDTDIFWRNRLAAEEMKDDLNYIYSDLFE